MPVNDLSKYAAKLMLTPQGQKLLLEARTLESRGPKWDAFMERVNDYLVRTGGVKAGED